MRAKIVKHATRKVVTVSEIGDATKAEISRMAHEFAGEVAGVSTYGSVVDWPTGSPSATVTIFTD